MNAIELASRKAAAAPTDLGLRLDLADEADRVGDREWAEFVRLQCKLRTAPPDRMAEVCSFAFADRVRSLLEKHRARWVKFCLERFSFLDDRDLRFRGGFIECLALQPEHFIRFGEKLCEAVPFVHLEIAGRSPGIDLLARCPTLSRMMSLSLIGGRRSAIAKSDFHAIVISQQLRNIEFLSLVDNHIDDDCIARFCASQTLRKLKVLLLQGNVITDEGVRSLSQWPGARSLRVLNLSGTLITDLGIRHLTESPLLCRKPITFSKSA